MNIRVGIGGWTYEPWRGTFYPPGLPHALELAHASRQLTSIEVNGTFYRTQTPETFRKWAAEVPDGFVFSIKGPRYVVDRKNLAAAGEKIDWFFGSGLEELGDKLGPIYWLLGPKKMFDRDEIARFFDRLPQTLNGCSLRHAVEVRHESFTTPAFVELARERSIAITFADSDGYPGIADLTSDFVYARLRRSMAEEPAGYPSAALDHWADIAHGWARGELPEGLTYLTSKQPKVPSRDVFVYFISGAKAHNPAAATALIERLAKR
jgi:uncharacterized protein YecE (DUF72 family)